MLSILSLLLVVTFSILVTRTAAVALTYTGLSHDTARFQARSAFTGVGYTTREAEDIVNHPVRRRIVMTLMLLGNAGIVTAVSSLILTFTSASSTMAPALRILTILAGVIVLWALTRIPWVTRKLHQVIEAALRKWTTLEARDFEQILGLAGDYGVSELLIQEDDWLAHKSLRETNLVHEGVTVLGIHRPDGTYIGVPTSDTRLAPKDRIIAYGRSSQLAEIDCRCSGEEGDRLHEEACAQAECEVAAAPQQPGA